jgi:hypothetical protein
MYRDVTQWLSIRNQILRKSVSIRQIVRETGISRDTVRKMLDHPLPQPYGPRSHRYPKLGPHTASVRRMLQENSTLPPSARLSIKSIYERIRDKEGFRGSYGSVKDYARPIAPDNGCIWEYAYDLLTTLERKRAIDFLFLLSRADPPVISRSRTEQFFRDAGRMISKRFFSVRGVEVKRFQAIHLPDDVTRGSCAPITDERILCGVGRMRLRKSRRYSSNCRNQKYEAISG